VTPIVGTDHQWFRRNLPDHLLDLLEGADRERFDAHARTCADCAKLLASATGARADWWDGAGHPPVDALLGWDADGTPARTREQVRAHLAGCESCRSDLRDLRGAEALSALSLAAVPASPHAARPARRTWLPALGGAGAVAAAVTLWVASQPARQTVPLPHVPASPPSAAVPVPTVEAAPPPARAPGEVAEPIEIRAAERGAETLATPVVIEPGQRRVRLTLPALAVPEDAPLTIEVRGPDGALALRQMLPAGRALRRGGVELPASALVAGPHALRVSWTDPVTGESSREYALDVRTSRPR
jgi:hypothetical protein